MVRYAAFGSNLHPVRLQARVSSAVLLGTSFLPGWELCFHKRSADESAKCNIIESGRGVYVAVYELDGRAKSALDRIEGVGKGYTNKVIDVPRFGACFAYHASTSHIEDSLRPYHWYKEIVLLGSQTLGFPDDYCDAIAATEAVEDPDQRRNDMHWDLIDVLRNGV